MIRLLAALALLLSSLPALAQDRPPSDCIALAQGEAQLHRVALAEDEVQIRYLGHASFALRAGRLLAVTDYTGQIGDPSVVPDVVTMNNAHDSHFTDRPDPRIPLVLKGWPEDGVPAAIDLDLPEVRIRNVTTDTRGPFGEGALRNGNSIFIFEAAGLCIAHLGHLHQVPSPAQYAAIGRVDVLMVPVDGAFTMSTAAMADVVRRLGARIVLPMHWFTEEGLARFLAELQGDFTLTLSPGPEIVVSRGSLPRRPEIVVLQPALLGAGAE